MTIRKAKLNIKLGELILFCLGMFSTMPIVCLHLFGRYVSFFSIFLIFGFLYLLLGFLNYGKIRSVGGFYNTFLFIIWLFFALISSVCGWIYFSYQAAWRSAATSNVNKIIIFIIFAFLWVNQKDVKKNSSLILQGILYGCIANLIWATIDGMGYYVFGVSLNNLIFHKYAIANDIRDGGLSIIRDGLIRAPGFNYDPAHLGFIVPSMLAYAIRKNKGWLLVLVFLALICSASTTALVCSVVVLVLNANYIVLNMKSSKVKKNLPIIALCLGIFLVILLIGYGSFISKALNKFLNRINSTYVDLNVNDYRLIYLTQFFKAVATAGPMIIFGTGFGTASYAYVFNDEILSRLGSINYFPYDMEMTYIAYLFDLGIVGFIIYLVILYKTYRYSSKSKNKNEVIIYSLLIGMILSGFFYHYTLMAMQVLVLLVGLSCSELVYVKKVKKFERVDLLLRSES